MSLIHSIFQRFAKTILLVLLSAVFFGALPVSAAQVLVAAASDLRFALDEIVRDYNSVRGQQITPVYGSSGNFARQIAQGAPFELFMSADESYIFTLQDQGFMRDAGALYALGRLALVSTAGSSFDVNAGLNGLDAATLRRFAIANPEHAPYGARAREALQRAGLWQGMESKLVFGENVSQAAQFAYSGNADGGIIAYSLALSPNLPKGTTYSLIPAEMHDPLRQRMALTSSAGAEAWDFYRYLQQPAAQTVLKRYGFEQAGGN